MENLPDWMILDAFRYALGRMSYQVSTTCDWLVANWEKLPGSLQGLIAKELREAFDRDDRARDRGDQRPYPLGMACDRLEWGRVLYVATRKDQE